MNRHSSPPQRIVILGGGTAGWITANAMIASWADEGVEIRLIESPEIGTVGVGEGSTPRLKQFFKSIGVGEAEWMPQCNATYKNGISFVDWTRKPGFERYYHPFPARTDQHTTGAFYFNTEQRRQGRDVHAHPDRFFLSATLSRRRLGPLPDENFPFEVEYGYHFDAALLARFLQQTATSRGVRHLAAKVTGVNVAPDGGIASLVTAEGEIIEADLFVDCSGFRAVLMQETLQIAFHPFAENLFNDAAVVLPTAQEAELASETVSTAMKHGWRWAIPLTHRIGNGYVYSSSYCSADAAEAELRECLGLLDDAVEARHLRMKVGRSDQHWHKNCLAVGLSQGFIEPLEATALNIVCSTVEDFIATVNARGSDGEGRDEFNRRVSEKFERIRDYIVAHYRLNGRDDTPYWRDNREHRNESDTLGDLSDCWRRGRNLLQEFEQRQIRSAYAPMSWYCIFAGHGQYPPLRQLPDTGAKSVDMAAIDDFVRRCAMNFRSQNELLGI